MGITSNGRYFIDAVDPGSTLWGVAFQFHSDVILESEAEVISGPNNDNNGYGLACRLDEEGDGYYMMISGDGFYAIVKFSGGSPVQLVDLDKFEFDQAGTGNRIPLERAVLATS